MTTYNTKRYYTNIFPDRLFKSPFLKNLTHTFNGVKDQLTTILKFKTYNYHTNQCPILPELKISV